MRSKLATPILKLSLFMLVAMSALSADMRTYTPPNGFVPDEATAVQVAEAILSPIYGEQKVKSERPYRAVLLNGVWLVEGSLPKGALGGVAMVEISKTDGRIISVSHEK